MEIKSLLAVTTCFLDSRAFFTYLYAGSIPPISSITTSILLLLKKSSSLSVIFSKTLSISFLNSLSSEIIFVYFCLSLTNTDSTENNLFWTSFFY